MGAIDGAFAACSPGSALLFGCCFYLAVLRARVCGWLPGGGVAEVARTGKPETATQNGCASSLQHLAVWIGVLVTGFVLASGIRALILCA
jgi:hypothetical protein